MGKPVEEIGNSQPEMLFIGDLDPEGNDYPVMSPARRGVSGWEERRGAIRRTR